MHRAQTLLLSLSLLSSHALAQDRTSESGEAAISDPVVECSPYSYAPVTNALAQFPTVWSLATALLPSDTEGQTLFKSINSSIPPFPPQGTSLGDFSAFTPGYNVSDPDCWWTFHQCVTPKWPGLPPDIANVPEPKTLGYGFDDGPNCSHNAFYDYLTQQNQKASTCFVLMQTLHHGLMPAAAMFYIGSNVMNHPLEAQRAVADGHQICVHTWSHHYMTSFTNEGAFAELWYALKAIKLVTGVTPLCWRPPFGDVDDRIRFIAKALNLTTIIWQRDSFDWENGQNGITNTTVQGNYDSLISDVQNGKYDTAGAIMLTHELNNYTMQIAVDNYPALSKAFSHIVPIAVAMNESNPYAEKNITFQTFQQYISNQSASASASPSGSAGSGTGSAGAAQATGGKSDAVVTRVPVSVALLVALFAAAALI
ncbi:unnamed protein product [Mycena citricolor]|uniref:chitin deacetylase n=1 Tax=Mycena citricolor TaxID=2018698 RepID=A0AAD2HHA8_9AGAR|nr:unnamed protein product [Mycena citricolor]